jgi:hypothetical protein
VRIYITIKKMTRPWLVFLAQTAAVALAVLTLCTVECFAGGVDKGGIVSKAIVGASLKFETYGKRSGLIKENLAAKEHEESSRVTEETMIYPDVLAVRSEQRSSATKKKLMPFLGNEVGARVTMLKALLPFRI